METTTKITTGVASILLIVSLVMGANLIGQKDVYVCIETKVVMKCDKLSSVNEEGTQTRCYYEDEIENRTRYKNCKSGWIEYKQTTSTVEEKVNETKEGQICKVIRGKNIIKECVTELNETYLYIVRF